MYIYIFKAKHFYLSLENVSEPKRLKSIELGKNVHGFEYLTIKFSQFSLGQLH